MADDGLLHAISPFFVVADLQASLAFYREQLGFETAVVVPEKEPFFAIVERGPVRVFLKEIGADTPPAPNHARHEWARWDAFIHSPNPDALHQEFAVRNVPLHRPLEDTEDGLRAFEVMDPNGYVLCFGCPR